MPQAPLPQNPLPQAGAAQAGSLVLAPALMNPAEISFSTGAAASVLPGGIPARSQSSPQVASLSAMVCRTSTIRPLASQRYSYVGTVFLHVIAGGNLRCRRQAKYSRSVAPEAHDTKIVAPCIFVCQI
jgi:hypothetical protein